MHRDRPIKRLLFAYDHKFSKNEVGEFFSPGKFSYRAWSRYLDHCDQLDVVGRMGASVAGRPPHLASSDGPRVSIHAIDAKDAVLLEFRKRTAAHRRLAQLVMAADGVIARLPSEIGLAALTIARKLKKPTAVEVVGCPLEAYWCHGALTAKLYAPLAYLRQRRAVRSALCALYVTESFLQGRYPTQGYRSVASNVEIDARLMNASPLPLNVSDISFATIGAVDVAYKGHETAIKALGYLRRKGRLPRFKYYLVGEGRPDRVMRLAHREGIASQVIPLGTMPGGESLLAWLDSVAVYLQPSDVDALPRALIEAASRGRICFASNVGGIPEVLPQEALHGKQDWRGLAALIEAALEKQDWADYQQALVRHVKACFGPEVLRTRRRAFLQHFARQIRGH